MLLDARESWKSIFSSVKVEDHIRYGAQTATTVIVVRSCTAQSTLISGVLDTY